MNPALTSLLNLTQMMNNLRELPVMSIKIIINCMSTEILNTEIHSERKIYHDDISDLPFNLTLLAVTSQLCIEIFYPF